ncbi:para-aminobenzoate synthetase component I / 4-amino-4-deoxychorismate lyase [Virgibacillus sp. SK37]|nr:para-aminobenzoate synthetase component I / 4-amino-4-deoxychorismate lyase [Virgibacillus sp. SK37]
MLYFNFRTDNKKEAPLLFQHPVRIIQASSVTEVLPALVEVQQSVNEGYYAAGYLSYEAAPAFDHAAYTHSSSNLPLLWFGIFNEPEQREIQSYKSFRTSKWSHRSSKTEYEENLNKIKEQIESGDTYQVNYTVRMHAAFQGDPLSYYTCLSKAQSANYGAYFNINDFSILSASPELFFHLKEGKITTRPMKGTLARGRTAAEDTQNKEWLYHSEKNRAENVMIVDLLRNDLGAIAIPGTVKVPHLFSIETYPTVHQMTSTVTAELEENHTITDIFKALFPCGSITGAPKISTMRIINELEDEPRDVYCGTMGYITPENEAVFNVPIRTVILDKEKGIATYGVGGGITWDSKTDEEYEEVITKAKVLEVNHEPFRLLESIGCEHGEIFLLELHVERLKRAADFFNFQIDTNKIKQDLTTYIEGLEHRQWKVRLLADEYGDTEIEAKAVSPFNNIPPVGLATKPIDRTNPFLYYKTTNRSVYKEHLSENTDVFDALLWNENREITEFTNGNIVVEKNGKRYTPPVESGLLAGTFRKHLLEKGEIEVRKIMLDELPSYSRIWLINSVRRWVEVKLI